MEGTVSDATLKKHRASTNQDNSVEHLTEISSNSRPDSISKAWSTNQ